MIKTLREHSDVTRSLQDQLMSNKVSAILYKTTSWYKLIMLGCKLVDMSINSQGLTQFHKKKQQHTFKTCFFHAMACS